MKMDPRSTAATVQGASSMRGWTKPRSREDFSGKSDMGKERSAAVVTEALWQACRPSVRRPVSEASLRGRQCWPVDSASGGSATAMRVRTGWRREPAHRARSVRNRRQRKARHDRGRRLHSRGIGDLGWRSNGLRQRVTVDRLATAASADTDVDVAQCQQHLGPGCLHRRRGGTSVVRPRHDQRARDSEFRLDVSRGIQAVVSNLHETSREDVLYKSSEEVRGGERAAITVLRAKRHAAIGIEGLDAMIRNADTMGVSTEVRVHLLGAREGFLCVHEPTRSVELVAHASESVGCVGGTTQSAVVQSTIDRIERARFARERWCAPSTRIGKR